MTRPQARPTPPFYYDLTVARYRDSKGRFISPLSVKQEVDQVCGRVAQELRMLTEMRRNGEMSVQTWGQLFKETLANHHTAMVAAAAGGFDQMGRRHHARLQGTLNKQFDYFNGWLTELANGQVRPEMELARAELYALAGGQTFTDFDRVENVLRGKTHKRNVLGVADHCRDCLRMTALGWVHIHAAKEEGYIPRGERICLVRCQCFEVYATEAEFKAWAKASPGGLPPEADAEKGAWVTYTEDFIPATELRGPREPDDSWLRNPIPEELTPQLVETLQEEERRIARHNILPLPERHEEGILIDRNGAILYRKKGKTVAEGDGYSVRFEDHETAAMRGMVLTHNHPGTDEGASFSEADITVLIKHRLNEIRAVGNRYTYRMRMDPEVVNTKNADIAGRDVLGAYSDAKQEIRREMDALLLDDLVDEETAEQALAHLGWDYIVRKTPGLGLTYYVIDGKDGSAVTVTYDPESETELDRFRARYAGAEAAKELEAWWRDPLPQNLTPEIRQKLSRFRDEALADGNPRAMIIARNGDIAAEDEFETQLDYLINPGEGSLVWGGVGVKSFGGSETGLSFSVGDYFSSVELRLREARIVDKEHTFILQVNPELIRKQDTQTLTERLQMVMMGLDRQVSDLLPVLENAGLIDRDKSRTIARDIIWEEIATRHPELGVRYQRINHANPALSGEFSHDPNKPQVTSLDRLREQYNKAMTDAATAFAENLRKEDQAEFWANMEKLKAAGITQKRAEELGEAVLAEQEERIQEFNQLAEPSPYHMGQPIPALPEPLPPEVVSRIEVIEAEIRRLRTHEEGAAFDHAGNLISRKVGQRSSVEYTDEEMEQMVGMIFTHNHPLTKDGSAFSTDDVGFMLKWRLAEMRAVGGRYTYRIRMDPKILNSPSWLDAQKRTIGRLQFDAMDRSRRAMDHEMRQGRLSLDQGEDVGWDLIWDHVARRSQGLTYIKEDKETGEVTVSQMPEDRSQPALTRLEELEVRQAKELEGIQRANQLRAIAEEEARAAAEKEREAKAEARGGEPGEAEAELDYFLGRDWEAEKGINPILLSIRGSVAKGDSKDQTITAAERAAYDYMYNKLIAEGVDEETANAFAELAASQVEEFLRGGGLARIPYG